MKRKGGSMELNWEQRFAALAMVASDAGIPSSIIAEIQQRSLGMLMCRRERYSATKKGA